MSFDQLSWQPDKVLGVWVLLSLHPTRVEQQYSCYTLTSRVSHRLLPDVIHLLTEKHWLQLMVTTEGEGTVESVLAAT